MSYSMRPLSLRTKILSRLAVISMCAMTLLLVVLYRYVSKTFEAELIKRGTFIANSLADSTATPILTQRDLALALMMRDTLEDERDLAYIFIVDRNGNLVAHTFGNAFPRELKGLQSPDSTKMRRIRFNHRDIIDIPSPILGGALGVLHAGISGAAIDKGLQRIFLLAAGIIVILFLTAAILMWLTIEQTVIRPVQKLESMIRRIQEGEAAGAVEVSAQDEIGQLGQSFNLMAGHLSHVDRERNRIITELNESNIQLTAMIAEREQAESRLADSEEKLRLILDSAGEGIYGLDPEGRCTFCNTSCLRLLGYEKAEDLIGRKMHAQIHHSYPDGTPYPVENCQIYQTFLNGTNVHLSRDLLWRSDGSSLPVEYWSYPQIKDRLIVGAVVTFVDISDRLEAEEENRKLQSMLLQSQKMDAIGTLAGGIAHDFNNILSVIFGYAEIVRMRCESDSSVREDLDQVLVAASRARDLVSQILAFSRKSESHKQPVDLAPLVKETLKLIRSSIPSTIEIRQQVVPKAVTLADPSQIHQVIMNLCTNAAHAMAGKGGILAVSLKTAELDDERQAMGIEVPPGRYAVVEISDTGCGMDEETKQKIFEPYFTTKEKGKGSGLGLAVAHGIIKAHGGKITVYSEPGVGTTFHVFLPLTVSEALPEVAAVHASREPTKGERILFVDDEQQIRELAMEYLQGEGYGVEVCINGMSALDRFKANPSCYDLVVTDMAMPGMNGKDLANEILRIRPEIPVILCTGYSELINGESSRQIGIREYLQKPVQMSLLCERIRGLLDA